MIYTAFLVLHSWLRWVALALIVVSVVLAILKDNGPRAKRASLLTMIMYDMQLLIGLVLYAFLSPITTAAFANFGAAMRDSVTRFWAVEHIFGMIIAVVLVHLGHALGKRATDDASAAKKRLIFFGLGLVVTLLLIPWPFRAAGRALFWLG